MVTVLFLTCWCAAPILKTWAAIRMAHNRLSAPYRGYWIYLVLSSLRSAAAIPLWTRPAYRDFLASTAPLMLAAAGVAWVAVFWRSAGAFLNFRKAASVILAITITAGLCTSIVAGSIVRTPVAPAWKLAASFEWYGVLLAGAAALCCGWLLPRSPLLQKSRDVAWVSWIVAAHLVGWLLGSSSLFAAPNTWWPYFAPVGTEIAVGVLWLRCPPPPRYPMGFVRFD